MKRKKWAQKRVNNIWLTMVFISTHTHTYTQTTYEIWSIPLVNCKLSYQNWRGKHNNNDIIDLNWSPNERTNVRISCFSLSLQNHSNLVVYSLCAHSHLLPNDSISVWTSQRKALLCIYSHTLIDIEIFFCFGSTSDQRPNYIYIGKYNMHTLTHKTNSLCDFITLIGRHHTFDAHTFTPHQ